MLTIFCAIVDGSGNLWINGVFEMKKWQKVLLTIICVLAVLALAVVLLIKFVLLPKVTDVAIEKAVAIVAMDEYAAEELIDSLSPEDKEFAEEIITDYLMDGEARSTMLGYYKNNDYTAMKDYAVTHLSDDQMNRALDIADQYREFISPEGQAMLDLYLNNRE